MYSGHKSFVRYVCCEYFLAVCGLPFHFLGGAVIFFLKCLVESISEAIWV